MLNKKFISAVAALATIASVALAAPAAQANDTAVTGEGSSFAGGILTACAASWKPNGANSGDTVTYTGSSSGSGRSKFNAGTIDFGGTDAPYAAADTKPSDLIYVPLIAGPIAVAFNVPGVSSLNLTSGVLGRLLNGKINKWNDQQIAKLNKSANLPDLAVSVVYRNTDSGTTENFTNYLAQNKSAGWTSNKSFASAGGYTGTRSKGQAASKDVVKYIANNAGTIGYADLKDTMSSNLKFAAIKNGFGQYVKPSAKTASLFLASPKAAKLSANGTVKFDYTAAVPGAYNVDLVTYGLAHSTTSAKGASVKKFFSYVISTCAPAVANLYGYVPVAGKILDRAKLNVARIK